MKSCMNRIRGFFRRESGLVAVEWVALTSGLVIGAIIIGVTIMDGTQEEAIGMTEDIQIDGCNAALAGAAAAGGSSYGVTC
jgi:hypothetical protein